MEKNREIKFRGQRNDRKWLYGDLSHYDSDRTFIFPDEALDSIDNYEIKPETVGQFTNLPNNIYEHDIIASKIFPNVLHVIIWSPYNCCFSAISKESYNLMQEIPTFRRSELVNARGVKPEWILEYDFQVIGNMFDNPDLLKAI